MMKIESRYWTALFAAIGLAAISFGAGAYWVAINRPDLPAFPSYRSTTSEGTETSARAPSTGALRRPCEDANGLAESDLCAQWRAATASEDSAYWAWLAAVLALTGTAATLTAIALAYGANKIASETAKSQLRPYVFIEQSRLWGDEDKKLFIATEVKNYGVTPAIDVETKFQYAIAPANTGIADADMRVFMRSGVIAPSAISAVGDKVEILNGDNIRAVRRGEMAIYIRCAVSYTWAGTNGQRDGFDATMVCSEPFLDRGIFRNVR